MSDDLEQPTGIILGADKSSVQATETTGLRTRENFAVLHMLAAARFARRTGEIEEAHKGEQFADFFEEIIHYASASILFSAAALEAYINELFIDAHIYLPEHRPQVSDEIWALAWERIERQPILEKYATALTLKKRPIFWKHVGKKSAADGTYSAVSALVKVRDALLHFKPQWEDETKSHSDLTALLKKQPIGSSPFLGPEQSFPKMCMSHECAKWAVTSSLDFVAAFSQAAGLVNKFDYFKPRLSPS